MPVNTPGAEEVRVQLSAFEVKADSDNSYGALNSNSITRFNTELSKLPVSADIMSETFMQDVGAVSVEAMISTYSGGGGFANFNASTGAAQNQPGENNSPAFTTLRGLTASTTRRDGFMSMTTFNSSGSTSGGYTSNFDIERVEVINGPQSLLYGNGGAGGVVNMVSKRAQFRKPAFGSFTFRMDDNDSKVGQVSLGSVPTSWRCGSRMCTAMKRPAACGSAAGSPARMDSLPTLPSGIPSSA